MAFDINTFNIPLDEIPDEAPLPPAGDVYTLQAESLEMQESQNSGNIMAKLVWQIALGEHAGHQGYKYFVFGKPDELADPKNEKWKGSPGTREFKKFSTALGYGGVLPATEFPKIEGMKWDSVLDHEAGTGNFRSKAIIRFDSYYPEGQGPNGNERPTFTAPPKAQAPAAPTAPSRPAAVAPARPQAPARPGPQRPAPRQAVVEEEEG